MNTKLLIDSIVQQTTVLIAQLSTAAGLRAPLAHVADEVFVSLARTIEDQGVGRKVVADMFGLALRTYQRKVQRLTESATVRERTLWESVLEFLTENGSTTKQVVVTRFWRDDERRVLAVLSDLVQSGLVYSSGRGAATLYRATTPAEREALGHAGDRDALGIALWATVFHEPGVRASQLRHRFRLPPEQVDQALQSLKLTGQIQTAHSGDDAPLMPTSLVIPLGDEAGWEAAVYDHFQALVRAVIKKLELGKVRARDRELVGGSTFHFSVYTGHPYEDEVLSGLERVRSQMSELFEKVTTYNRAHPRPEHERTRVTFYFGQSYSAPPGENGGESSEATAGGDGGPTT